MNTQTNGSNNVQTTVVTFVGQPFLRHFWPEFNFVKYEKLIPVHKWELEALAGTN